MYYAGIDLGGTNIAAGLINEENQIVARAKQKTKLGCSGDETCGQLADVLEELVKAGGISKSELPYVGLGCPGTINQSSGVVEFCNNLQQLNAYPLRAELEKRTGVKVLFENDANAAAWGEHQAGALRGADDALAITLGTGVGSGIIIDGKLYSGFNFAGAEMGHIVIQRGGRQCTCGRRGCWEAYSSATGLIATTKEFMQAHPESGMWKLAPTLDQVGGRTAFDAMRAGDETGKAVVDEYIGGLACGLASAINIFQPEIICIGGGVCNEGDTLLVPLRALVEKEVFSRFSKNQTQIRRAELGNDAGILGAALLGISGGNAGSPTAG